MTFVVPEPYATALVRPTVDPETGTEAPRLPTLPLEPELSLSAEPQSRVFPDVSELPDLPELDLLPPDFPPLPPPPPFAPPPPPPPFRGYSRWLSSVTPGMYIRERGRPTSGTALAE